MKIKGIKGKHKPELKDVTEDGLVSAKAYIQELKNRTFKTNEIHFDFEDGKSEWITDDNKDLI